MLFLVFKHAATLSCKQNGESSTFQVTYLVYDLLPNLDWMLYTYIQTAVQF
jgi:hypothetical protein